MKRRYNKHMTPLAALVMRDLYFIGKLKQHQLVRMFGVNQGHVSKIISSVIWG